MDGLDNIDGTDAMNLCGIFTALSKIGASIEPVLNNQTPPTGDRVPRVLYTPDFNVSAVDLVSKEEDYFLPSMRVIILTKSSFTPLTESLNLLADQLIAPKTEMCSSEEELIRRFGDTSFRNGLKTFLTDHF